MPAVHEKWKLCPMSGVGKDPRSWNRCVTRCAWYDALGDACIPNVFPEFLASIALSLKDISAAAK